MADFTVNLSAVSTQDLEMASTAILRGEPRAPFLVDLLTNLRTEIANRFDVDSIGGLTNELTKYSSFQVSPTFFTQEEYDRLVDAAVRLYEAELLLSLAGLLIFPIVEPSPACFSDSIKKLSNFIHLDSPPHGEKPDVDALRERAKQALDQALAVLREAVPSITNRLRDRGLAAMRGRGVD